MTFFNRERVRCSMGNNPFAERTAYYLGAENSNSEWLRRFIIKHNRHPANRVPSWELPRLRMIVDILSRIEESKSDDIMNLFESISETGDTLKTTFVRSKDLEIGYFNGKIDSNSVSWVSDCECIYRKINPMSLNEKKPVQMKILSTENNSYTFEYSFVGDTENKQRGYVRKLSN